MTPQQIDAYLKRRGSPLAGLGKTFLAVGAKYHVDPALLVAISGAESSFGKKMSGDYNPFGWGPGIDFPNFQVAIDTVAKGLRIGYLDQGRTTIPAIGAKWAPVGAANDPMGLNRHWATNVQSFHKELGGREIGGGSVPAASSATPAPTAASTQGSPDLTEQSLETLGYIAQGRHSPSAALGALTERVQTSSFRPPPSVTSMPAAASEAPYRGASSFSRKKASEYRSLSFAKDVKLQGVNGDLLAGLNGLAQHLGKTLTVVSGWRSAHEQYDLYQDYLAGRRAGPVAPAYRNKDGTYRSTSLHTSGEALDVFIDGVALGRVVSTSVLANYGLKTLGNDPGHTERA